MDKGYVLVIGKKKFQITNIYSTSNDLRTIYCTSTWQRLKRVIFRAGKV